MTLRRIDFTKMALSPHVPLALGGAALGGLGGYLMSDDENKGLGTAFGAAAGAATPYAIHHGVNKLMLLQNAIKNQSDADALKFFAMTARDYGPAAAGGALGGTLGGLLTRDVRNEEPDEYVRANRVRRGIAAGAAAGTALGVVGVDRLRALRNHLLDKAVQRRVRQATERTINMGFSPFYVSGAGVKYKPPLRLPSGIKTGAFESSRNALIARLGAGAVLGGAGGAYFGPQFSSDIDKLDDIERQRLRARGALIGALFGTTASGLSKLKSNFELDRLAKKVPDLEHFTNDMKKSFF